MLRLTIKRLRVGPKPSQASNHNMPKERSDREDKLRARRAARRAAKAAKKAAKKAKRRGTHDNPPLGLSFQSLWQACGVRATAAELDDRCDGQPRGVTYQTKKDGGVSAVCRRSQRVSSSGFSTALASCCQDLTSRGRARGGARRHKYAHFFPLHGACLVVGATFSLCREKKAIKSNAMYPVWLLSDIEFLLTFRETRIKPMVWHFAPAPVGMYKDRLYDGDKIR